MALKGGSVGPVVGSGSGVAFGGQSVWIGGYSFYYLSRSTAKGERRPGVGGGCVGSRRCLSSSWSVSRFPSRVSVPFRSLRARTGGGSFLPDSGRARQPPLRGTRQACDGGSSSSFVDGVGSGGCQRCVHFRLGVALYSWPSIRLGCPQTSGSELARTGGIRLSN